MTGGTLFKLFRKHMIRLLALILCFVMPFSVPSSLSEEDLPPDAASLSDKAGPAAPGAEESEEEAIPEEPAAEELTAPSAGPDLPASEEEPDSGVPESSSGQPAGTADGPEELSEAETVSAADAVPEEGSEGSAVLVPEAPAGSVEEHSAPAEAASAEEAPVKEAQAEEAPAENVSVDHLPEEEASAEEAPGEEASEEEASAEKIPAAEVPAEKSPAEEAPAEETPVKGAPAADAPAEEITEGTPEEAVPAEGSPVEETPEAEIPVIDDPDAETPDEDTPAEGSPAEDTPSAGDPAAEVPAEEASEESPAPADILPEEEPAEEDQPEPQLPVSSRLSDFLAEVYVFRDGSWSDKKTVEAGETVIRLVFREKEDLLCADTLKWKLPLKVKDQLPDDEDYLVRASFGTVDRNGVLTVSAFSGELTVELKCVLKKGTCRLGKISLKVVSPSPAADPGADETETLPTELPGDPEEVLPTGLPGDPEEVLPTGLPGDSEEVLPTGLPGDSEEVLPILPEQVSPGPENEAEELLELQQESLPGGKPAAYGGIKRFLLHADGGLYSITVVYSPETGVPEDAELWVDVLDEGGNLYKQYREEVNGTLADDTLLTGLRLFRLTLVYGSEKAAPKGDGYQVTVSFVPDDLDFMFDFYTVAFPGEPESR